MAQAGQVFVNFGANTQGLLAGTARAGNILRRFSQTGVGAAIVMGASFVTLSRIMTSFATSAIGGFKDFEYHIVRAKALSGATTEEFEKMRDTAEELGRTTEFMAKDIAAGMSNLALAGFNALEIIDMIPDALRLATAGGVNLAKTNTIMANAIRGFGLEADQANQVANVMTATFTTTNTTLESLAQTFKNAVGVLATLGVKMEEVAAAAGVLGDVGINASVAGTGLKNLGIKLAKTFGMMKDGTKSAREFFENLGVTKERLFDVETGAFNIVEAIGAFKESMDKLGRARAPEFLAQFAKLFGARAAASLTALVRQADQFRIQAENTRMTEMIGDVQQVFERMQKIGNNTLYMTKVQEGMNNSVLTMVEGLRLSSVYMEEFTESGQGARAVIERISHDFEETSQIMEKTFGTGSKGALEFQDGLLQVTKFTKNNAKEMVKYSEILDELAKKDIGAKRRQQLEQEAEAYKKIISAEKRTFKELTSLGRARGLTLAAQIKSIEAMKGVAGVRSKEAAQIEALNDIYKGNEKNIVLAATAMGIQIKKSDKLSGSLSDVKNVLLKTTISTEQQRYAMERLVSQTVMTNTAMNMQRIQLETLDGTFKLFKSGIELVSNKIAKSLAPAIDSVIKSSTLFLRALTLSNDEVARGVTATEKLNDALNDTFKIFRKDGGVFKDIKKNFEGLSSIGKVLAATIGSLGAAGLAAGGAFIWVQAMLPALLALGGTFFTMVLPISATIGLLVLLGIKLKKAHEEAKKLGAAAKQSGDAMIQVYLSIKSKLDIIIKAYDKFIERIETSLGLVNRFNIVGGKFVLFKPGQKGELTTIQNTVESLEAAFKGLSGESTKAGGDLIKAFKSGDASEMNRILKENKELTKAIGDAGLEAGFATKAQTDQYINLNGLIMKAKKNQAVLAEDAKIAKKAYREGNLSKEASEKAEKKLAIATADVLDLEERKNKLHKTITDGKGKSGKLTNKEKKDLREIQKVITTQAKIASKAKKEYEKQIELQKQGKKNQQEIAAAFANARAEQDKLIDSQKEYNSILNKAVDKNPFILIARYIKDIVAGKEFQKFLTQVAIELAKVMDAVFGFMMKVAPVVWNFMKSVGKAIKQMWPAISQLLGAVKNLFGVVFNIIIALLGDVFGLAEGKGASTVAVLTAVIQKVAVWIEKIANKLREMPYDKIKQMAKTFGMILVALIGMKVAFGFLGGIIGKFKSLVTEAASFGTAIASLTGGGTGATALTAIFAKVGPMITGIVGAVGGIGPAILIVAAIIVGIMVLVSSMITAFKENFGGFRDQVMNFIGTVVIQIKNIAAKGMEMLGSFFSLIKTLGEVLAPIVGTIFAQIFIQLRRMVKFIGGIISFVMQLLSGVFQFIDGLLSGNWRKMLEGLINIGESIIQIIIKVFAFVIGKIIWLKTAIMNIMISIFQAIIGLILRAVSFIPGAKELKKRFDGFAEGLKKGIDTVQEIPGMLEDKASKGVGNFSDMLKAKLTGETTAEYQTRRDREKREKIEKKAKEKAEKEAKKQEAQDIKSQKIADGMVNMANKQGETNDKLGKLDPRPNVTNNTVVEYKAAEDDEVNRRMIETIMNDILKADVGMEMGDTSEMD